MKSIRILIAFLLFPLSLGAFAPVSDAELSAVTGQSGISINPDLTMNIHADVIAWGDSDGLGPSGSTPWPNNGPTTGGYIGLCNFDIKGLTVKLRDSDTYGGYTPDQMRPMTIDVATGLKNGVETTFVRISPGSLKIGMDSIRYDVVLGASPESLHAPGQVLLTTGAGGMEGYVNPKSYIDVYAHGKSGVAFGVNVVLDSMKADYLSWGTSR